MNDVRLMQVDEGQMKPKPFVSLRVRLLVAFTLVFTIAGAVLYYNIESIILRLVVEVYRSDLETALVATIDGIGNMEGIDPAEFQQLVTEVPPSEGQPDNPLYRAHQQWLKTVHEVYPHAYPYTYIQGSKPTEVLFVGDVLWEVSDEDRRLASSSPPPFLSPYESEGGLIGGLRATEGVHFKLDPYDDEWGTWISAYAPIQDADNNVVGAVGIDFDVTETVDVSVDSLQRYILLAFIPTYVVMFLLALVAATALTRSIARLTDGAEELGEGNYDNYGKITAPLHNALVVDETVVLAAVFDSMANKIRQREESLREQVAQLKIEVDEAKQSQHVQEIVDSEFFQDLRARAATMRDRRRSHDEGQTTSDAESPTPRLPRTQPRRASSEAEGAPDPAPLRTPLPSPADAPPLPISRGDEDFDTLWEELNALQKAQGLTPADVITLPPRLSSLLRHLLTGDGMTRQALAEELHITPEQAAQVGNLLVEKGFFAHVDNEENDVSEVRYNARWPRTRRRNIPAELLDDL